MSRSGTGTGKKSTQLIKHICCKQRTDHDFSKEERIKSDCKQTCGLGYLLYALNSHPNTHSFEHIRLVYDKIIVVDQTAKGQNVNGIALQDYIWKEFKSAFIVQFVKYMKHLTSWIWQHKYKINVDNLLTPDSLALHVDYINKPIVKYYHKTNNQWGTQGKFT